MSQSQLRAVCVVLHSGYFAWCSIEAAAELLEALLAVWLSSVGQMKRARIRLHHGSTWWPVERVSEEMVVNVSTVLFFKCFVSWAKPPASDVDRGKRTIGFLLVSTCWDTWMMTCDCYPGGVFLSCSHDSRSYKITHLRTSLHCLMAFCKGSSLPCFSLPLTFQNVRL